jgi:hypothetical protein
MNRVPGSKMLQWLVGVLLCLPGLVQAQQPANTDTLNYRPQQESNARGSYPQPQAQPGVYGQNWAYPPTQRQPPPYYQAPPAPQGMPYAPPQRQPGWQGGNSPFGFGQTQPQTWQGGANPYGYGQPQQPGQWSGRTAPQPGYSANTAPRLEITLKEQRAYVHQNLVLTLEVISQTNLRTVSVDLPDTESVVLRELGEATADYRNTAGRREIVNRLHYQLTPMQIGEIEIPSLSVSGKMENGREYRAHSDKPLKLSILPADASVRPWLPLKNLELTARLLNDEKVAEGQPITLVIEQTAEGMSGSQLPSLENKLHSKHHRIYREKTESSGRITTDGKLIGTRTDHFTLVPQDGNRIQIPAVKVDWWNADKQRKETAIIPGRLLGSGELFDDLSEKFADMPFAGGNTWLFWMPLIITAFIAGLYWSWVWARSRTLGKHVRQWASTVFHPLTFRINRITTKLSPQRQIHRVRRLVANVLPRSSRLWYCVRAADQERDPDDWAQVLRFLLNRRLGISAQRPMAQLAEDIIAVHKPRRPEEVRRLLKELEAGLFGPDARVNDFHRWKKAFKRQIRPNPLRFMRFRCKSPTSGLPALNPQI